MTKSLFDDFNSVSAKAWKQKIQLDLQGEEYQNIIWKSPEGIDVKPFYTLEDLQDFSHDINMPNSWSICETIYTKSGEDANAKALYSLSKGSDSLKFIIPNTAVSVSEMLRGIDTSSTNVYADLSFLDAPFIINNWRDHNINFNIDIIGNLTRSGNWYIDLKNDFNHFKNIVRKTHRISIDGTGYQNAGANVAQEIAYVLAHTNEYLNCIYNDDILRLQFEKKLDVTIHLFVKIAVGSNYFFEIAKLRAIRLLINKLCLEYHFKIDLCLEVTPSKRNKTLYDYNTNMIRTTTEIMSAILGGANLINNLDYDALYHKKNEFGSRISRNQLLILKHESYFNSVKNASDGAYYIESLTNQLAKKSLLLFKKIENNKGFISQLFKGTIQRKIKESATKEQHSFDNNTEILVGTNKYQNPNDKMQNELELYPFKKTKVRKTLIEPIIETRLSETIEKERLKNEKK